MGIFRRRQSRLGLFEGLALILFSGNLYGQTPEADPNPVKQIAELAKTDATAAVQALRDVENPDPYFLDDIFKDLDNRAHLRLLHEITGDESLANRFVFESQVLMVKIEKDPEPERLKEVKSIGDGLIRARNDSILELLDRAPRDLPPVLLLPSVWQTIYMTSIVDGFFQMAQLYPGDYRPVPAALRGSGTPSHSPVVLPVLTDFPWEKAPERFHEVLRLTEGLIQKKPETVRRVEQLIDEAALPLSVRLGFAGMAGGAPDLPPETRVKIARWLAEAWESGVPTGYFLEASLLRRFLRRPDMENWETAARRLLAAWPGDEGEQLEDPLFWMIGIAGMLDEREPVEALIEELEDDPPSLSSDPLLALLVRSGEVDLAFDQITERTETLLRERSPNRVVFDSLIETHLPDLLRKIGDPEVRFIVELHLKILDDDTESFPPKTPRTERIREMARRYGTVPFRSGRARLTALRLIGKAPAAAAEIAAAYVAYANFDQADLYLGDVMKADDWTELVDDAMKAVLAAGDYGLAREVLEKLAKSTGRLRDNFHRDAHAEAWEIVSDAIAETLESADEIPRELLPTARYVCGLPENFFPLNDNYSRGNLIGRTMAAHAAAGAGAEWWAWRAELDPGVRLSHDTSFIAHLKRVDHIRFGIADSWLDLDSGKVKKKVHEGIGDYLPLIRLLEAVPRDLPVEERLDAVVRHFKAAGQMPEDKRPDNTSAIRVLHRFCYFSSEELFAHAEELVSAIPEDPVFAWNELSWIAADRENLSLAKKFAGRANATFRKADPE